MTLKNIKLYYFDAQGRAELTRIILAAAGVKYEDIRYTFQTWPAEKSKMPFGQLPVISVDGKMFGQSLAIATFVAKEAGFYPKNNLDGLKVDQVVQLGVDFQTAAVKAFFEKDEAKKSVYEKELKEVEVPKYLDIFEKLLKESGTGYFVGTTLTLADFCIYDLVAMMIGRGVLSTSKHPLVDGLVKKIESNPNVKTYLANRKKTDF
ncbi:glutathione S-transferase 1-like [Physella acuta]|uniref:glutathione S-transferase 1-like n=1 Tax=Physella acuta TaxID=109671 RepID=UPI0027DE2D90|nr:glutathione S-transferase 1-like [Physella acuta]XP_059143206.1 glutathione S-transferase 1-like [Physella acuta]